jgi:hypothetical protein
MREIETGDILGTDDLMVDGGRLAIASISSLWFPIGSGGVRVCLSNAMMARNYR